MRHVYLGGTQQEATLHLFKSDVLGAPSRLGSDSKMLTHPQQVAINRGLRLADKRSLPCPNRQKWLTTQDTIYEEIMTKGWCEEKQHFRQSYDSDALDSCTSFSYSIVSVLMSPQAVCIMPLVFFISPVDPRFLSTMKQVCASRQTGTSLIMMLDHEKP